MSDKECKSNITVKNHLPTTVTQCWMPPIKYGNWINVLNEDMSQNGSYPSCS